MSLLSNPRHERFAQLVATGQSAAEAYRAVYGAKGKAAENSGSRLLGNVGVSARIAELQQKAAEKAVLTLVEKREFLRRVVMTAIRDVDERSNLCQSVECTDKGRKFRMPDKLRAIELDAKLAGEFLEQSDVNLTVHASLSAEERAARLKAIMEMEAERMV